MKKHTLRLLGDSTGTVRLPAESLLEAVGALVDGAWLATCFLVDGVSKPKGAKPAWLEAACALEVTGLRNGSAIVDVEAPVLGDVVGRDLLRQLRGVAHRASVVLREPDASRMELLRDETPGPRAVRVAGVLDTISVSKSDIFGKRVVATGMAHFGPSGKLLLGDTEYLGAAEPGDEIFDEATVAQVGCEHELGISLDTSEQVSNWGRRPLDADRLNHAALDAEILLALRERFESVLSGGAVQKRGQVLE